MDAIYNGKTNELTAKYAENQLVLEEISLLQQDINQMKGGGEKLFMELLRENPYPRGVLWFSENQESLAYQLSHTLLNGKSESEQKYFAEDLKIAFNFLKSSLVTVDHKEFTKSDMKDAMVRTVKKSYYQQAFEILPTLVSDSYSDEFILYLRENCNYIKALL